MIKNIGALVFFFLFSAELFSFPIETFDNKEVMLDAFKKSSILKDGPLFDISYDYNNDILWVLGKSSVWLWQLDANKLKRIKLVAKDSNIFLQKMLLTDNEIFAASKNTLYKITFNPYQTIAYKSAPSKTLALIKQQKNIWWINTSGVYKLKDGKYLSKFKDIKFQAADKVYFNGKTLFWILRGKYFLQKIITPKKIKTFLIHKGRNRFINIAPFNNEIFIHTSYTVLKFDTQKRLTQAIPVEGRGRKLLAFDIKNKIHSFLFNDGLVEIYNLDKKKGYQTALSFNNKIPEVTKFVFSGNKIIVVYKRGFHIFNIKQR